MEKFISKKERCMELEFDSDTTEDEIMDELLRYRKDGLLAMTTINGCDIYNDSDNLADELYKAFNGISDLDFAVIKREKAELDGEYKLLENMLFIREDTLYKYYFGLMKKYVVPEKLESFENLMIRNYGFYSSHYEALRIASSIMTSLNYSSDWPIYSELNELFAMFDDGNGVEFLDMALRIVGAYAQNGDKLDKIMSTNVVEKDIKVKEKKIESLLGKTTLK